MNINLNLNMNTLINRTWTWTYEHVHVHVQVTVQVHVNILVQVRVNLHAYVHVHMLMFFASNRLRRNALSINCLLAVLGIKVWKISKSYFSKIQMILNVSKKKSSEELTLWKVGMDSNRFIPYNYFHAPLRSKSWKFCLGFGTWSWNWRKNGQGQTGKWTWIRVETQWTQTVRESDYRITDKIKTTGYPPLSSIEYVLLQ